MRRILHIDGSQGASGDMILGALVDLGVPLSRMRAVLGGLKLPGYTLRSRKLERCSLIGRKVDVRIQGLEHGRNWGSIQRVLTRRALGPSLRDRALSIFRRLFEAEAEVHGKPVESVHLHEAGATDAIVDIVGACIGLEHLGLDRIVVSTLTTGFGEIRCAHGIYPVPAPATALLLRGVPARGGSIEAERLTPTGAAILTEIADDWGSLPECRPQAIGVGAGDRDLGSTPNMLRMTLGLTEDADDTSAEIVALECAVDDSTPQALAYATGRLFDAGALEVLTAPVVMKKGRLGHQLTVLGRPTDQHALVAILLSETTTLGLRVRREQRVEIERELIQVTTSHGTVRVKVGRLPSGATKAWPEYEDCAELARQRGVPLSEIQHAALQTWETMSHVPARKARTARASTRPRKQKGEKNR